MQNNLQNLNKIQQQMSSTKNFSKPSDDPLNVQRAMQLQTAIDANTQYASNIKTASKWMDTTDTALGQLGTALSNIRANLVKSGNAYSQSDKDKINDEVNQQISEIAQILNTNFEGEYIFGGTAGSSKPIMTDNYDITRSGKDDNGNDLSDYGSCVSLKYSNKDGKAIENLPAVVSDGFDVSKWQNKTIDFSIDGGTKISISVKPGDADIDAVVKDINSQIQSNTNLKDKINVVKTNNGNIKFLAVDSSQKITISTDIADMSKVNGKQLSNMDMENISSKKVIEVSQGVVLDYNATATEVMTYGDGADDNVSSLMDRVVHHLAGEVYSSSKADGSAVTSGDEGAVLGSDGKYYAWVYNSKAAQEELGGQDLVDMDAASSQVSKVRSQIGAKDSRMSDLGNQNSAAKLNLTDTLSNTEDIDLTKKTIEFATMITVYQACLQTGAKIMQPTLMDYIS